MIETLAERWPVIAVVIACVAILAFAGGAATNVGPWYKGLKFPRLKPPDWAFGPGWTLIYVFIASSAVIGWCAADAEGRRTMIWLFAVNAVLNVLWSPLFFTLRRPDWAFIEWVPFWLSIVPLVILMFWITPLAGWLILPYLLWVTYAGWLNWRVVVLNGPFDSRSSTIAAVEREETTI